VDCNIAFSTLRAPSHVTLRALQFHFSLQFLAPDEAAEVIDAGDEDEAIKAEDDEEMGGGEEPDEIIEDEELTEEEQKQRAEEEAKASAMGQKQHMSGHAWTRREGGKTASSR
jgi:hypothetical protein